MLMRIGVTGCGGYVGTTLVRHLLKQGYDVVGMDNFHKGQCDSLLSVITNHKFKFMYGDVTSLKDCEKFCDEVDGVIHLAAIVGFPACKRQPALSNAVNVLGTKNIVKARKDLPLVFASTGSVYGKVEDVCTEDSPCNPLTIYGIDKLEAESAVRNSGNSVALRFATGFGVSPCMRVNLLVNDLVYQAITNRCLTIFEADARRTFIHVNDMAVAFTKSLEKLYSGELNYNVYNAGDNDLNWTKRQLSEYIKRATGCLVTYAEIGKDFDQRDYEVSYDRFNKDIMKCYYGMEVGINELIKTAPLLQIRHQYE